MSRSQNPYPAGRGAFHGRDRVGETRVAVAGADAEMEVRQRDLVTGCQRVRVVGAERAVADSQYFPQLDQRVLVTLARSVPESEPHPRIERHRMLSAEISFARGDGGLKLGQSLPAHALPT